MAFGDNSTLTTTGSRTNVDVSEGDIFAGTVGANQFVIDQYDATLTGNLTIENFGKNDSILTTKKIFDGNNDGIINFGDNAVLDVERTGSGSKRAGDTQIGISGEDGAVTGLRYLGEKDGLHAYAQLSVRQAGWTEGKVSNDTFNAGTGSYTYLYDTALGLNLGADVINNFGSDDRIVTTSALFDADINSTVTFGKNGVLDLPGADGPAASDPAGGPGGQIQFTGLSAISFAGHENIGGVDYYYYTAA
ncbi:MAG: hypothetical protein E2598_05415 [Sphingobium sp.]|nr:hypothetical protein [Sphingobium sp.]